MITMGLTRGLSPHVHDFAGLSEFLNWEFMLVCSRMRLDAVLHKGLNCFLKKVILIYSFTAYFIEDPMSDSGVSNKQH